MRARKSAGWQATSLADPPSRALRGAVCSILTWNDPNVPRNLTKYSFKERMFKLDPPGNHDHLALHFSMDGCMLSRASDEAKMQEAAERKKTEERMAAQRKAKEVEGDDAAVEALMHEGGKNQFNYSERAAQTFNNPLKERGVATEPPPMERFGGMVTQWDIYDSYMERFELHLREAEMSKAGRRAEEAVGGDKRDERAARQEDDVLHSAAVGKSLKIVERMVNQNKEDEIYMDFKYWEDQSDEFRDGEGSLLPLWRFSSDRSRRKQVTSIAWHPAFPDLFAVGFGSYDFMHQVCAQAAPGARASPRCGSSSPPPLAQGSGLIYCYSLKNTSHPEFTFSTESGVMCLGFHPQHHALLAVGCYDGTVLVYDIRKKKNKSIYVSTIKTGKHTDPVWQVCWQEEDLAKELNFFSISSDGRVANWLMTNTELKMETVMQLKLVTAAVRALCAVRCVLRAAC